MITWYNVLEDCASCISQSKLLDEGAGGVPVTRGCVGISVGFGGTDVFTSVGHLLEHMDDFVGVRDLPECTCICWSMVFALPDSDGSGVPEFIDSYLGAT